jgi:flavin-binding protein dodecin
MGVARPSDPFPEKRNASRHTALFLHREERTVNDHVYKLLELTGSSAKSSDDAVQNAISKASKTMRNMQWFQVTDTRGHIADGRIAHWQVTLKIGFTLEE